MMFCMEYGVIFIGIYRASAPVAASLFNIKDLNGQCSIMDSCQSPKDLAAHGSFQVILVNIIIHYNY